MCFADVIPRFNHAYTVLKPITEEMDLEKYYDIYDISGVDFGEAMLGYSEAEFEDPDSLRVLKILAARFQTMRKVFLCCLMALDANGERADFSRWKSAVDEITGLEDATRIAEEQLNCILSEEESKFYSIKCGDTILTVFRFPCTTNTKATSHAKPGALACAAAKAKLFIIWYSRIAS